MKVKRILAGISLFIVAFVVIATIIMSNINLNYSVKCNTPNSISVRIGSSTTSIKASDKEKDEIIKLINNASSQSVLNGLFNGSLGKKAELQSLSGSNYYSIPKSSNGNYTIIFKYDVDNGQALKVGNKNYLVNGEPYLYKELYFNIVQGSGETEIKVYVNPYYYHGNSDKLNRPNNDTNYHYYYEVSGNFNNLLKYLQENWVI